MIPLQRKDTPTIRGVEYTGDNIKEVIEFYFPRTTAISIDRDTFDIVFRDLGDTDTLSVGDWVVEQDGAKGIIKKSVFHRRYERKLDATSSS